MSNTRLETDFFDALNNLNENLANNTEKFKALATQLDSELGKLRNANNALLQNAAKQEMATGIPNKAINIPNNLINEIGDAIYQFDRINIEAPKLLQKVGMFAGTPIPKVGAREVDAILSASIKEVENKNILEMQKQITSLYRLMETEIVKKDDANITKLQTLANQLNSNMTEYLNAGQALKQKSAQTLGQQQQKPDTAPKMGNK